MTVNWPERGIPILLSLIPGWGHIYCAREGRGLVLFTAAAISGFTLFNAIWNYLGDLRPVLIVVGALGTLGLLIYSIWDIIRWTSPERLQRIRQLRDRLLWEGSLCYLRADYLTAEEKFLQSAHLDERDVEPYFRAGMAALRRGATLESKRLLQKAQKLDTRLKWQWEIEEELKRLSVYSAEAYSTETHSVEILDEPNQVNKKSDMVSIENTTTGRDPSGKDAQTVQPSSEEVRT